MSDSQEEGRDWSVFVGALATLLLAVLFALVWSNDRSDYRDGGAFADLLAAFFSSVATLWLVVAVFRQGHELRLQRQELALQRDQLAQQTQETSRLANYNADIAKVSEQQREMAAKQYLLDEARSLVKGNSPMLHEFFNAAASKMMEDVAVSDTHGGYSFEQTHFVYERDGLLLIYKNPGQPEATLKMSKQDMVNLRTPPSVLKSMADIRESAEASGLGRWFRTRVPWLLESPIDAEEVSFFFDFLPIDEAQEP